MIELSNNREHIYKIVFSSVRGASVARRGSTRGNAHTTSATKPTGRWIASIAPKSSTRVLITKAGRSQISWIWLCLTFLRVSGYTQKYWLDMGRRMQNQEEFCLSNFSRVQEFYLSRFDCALVIVEKTQILSDTYNFSHGFFSRVPQLCLNNLDLPSISLRISTHQLHPAL